VKNLPLEGELEFNTISLTARRDDLQCQPADSYSGNARQLKIAKPKDDMNAGYISAFAALAGSLIGGLTTFAAAWVTQRQQANVQWLLQEKTRRQELYQQFIEEASKLYVDALIHDQAEIPPLVSLYASINKMRVVSNPGIAERADKVVRIIVDTYVLPNKSFQEVRAMMESGALDPLRDFSEACHEELSRLSSQALQFEYRRA
jgi:hypothetical protein